MEVDDRKENDVNRFDRAAYGYDRLTKRTCPECGRVFDLTEYGDAAEWTYGHDCEEVS